MSAESLVLEPDALLPEVPRKPAPWRLHGSAYVIALRLPAELLAQHAFVPPSLAGKLHSQIAYAMWVDYATANCGPYRELLFAPASFAFAQGHYPSITRIFVSTYESVVNGRANWGIPKDRADFAVAHGGGNDEVQLSRSGHVFAKLRLRPLGPALPVATAILPAGLRTIVQHWRGQSHRITLRASGKVKLARLLEWSFDSALFPDLSQGRVLGAVHLPSFDMEFPVARVEAL